MKIKRFLCKCIIIGGLVFTLLFNFAQKTTTQVPQATAIEYVTTSSIDLQKNIMQQKITNAETMITSVSNQVEYILMTIEGATTVNHDYTQNDNWKDNFIGSELTVKVNYKAIMSIPVDKITLTKDNNGMVYADYSSNDITIKSIEITQYESQQDRAMFGHKYTHDELLSMIEIAKNHINTRISSSEKVNKQCINNLNDVLISTCKQYGVYGVNINGALTITTPKYEFEKVANVRYGHQNKPIEGIDYIVVHSTANPNINATSHIKWLNNDESANAVHFYIDAGKVIQALDTNIQAQGTKGYNTITGDDSPIKNNNSIQIEICEYSDADLQRQAIENAEDFICEVLIPELNKQGYNPQVVSHNQAQGKNCPRIMLDKDSIITWNEFLEKIKK